MLKQKKPIYYSYSSTRTIFVFEILKDGFEKATPFLRISDYPYESAPDERVSPSHIPKKPDHDVIVK
jgi:hypothetical protein